VRGEREHGEFGDLRLSYAQHVYKAQGRTVQRAFVLTGGWQTDRERAYVALTRARDRTDLYASREDLGEQGTQARSNASLTLSRKATPSSRRSPLPRSTVPTNISPCRTARSQPSPATKVKSARAKRRRSSARPMSGETTSAVATMGWNPCSTDRRQLSRCIPIIRK